jgi:ATPase, YjeE family
MNETYITASVEETELLGAAFARELVQSYSGDCIFVAMYGDLGAGKTAFVRGFASVISPQSTVRSPTYTIVNEYRKGNISAIRLFHFDMYRITDEDELYSIGFHDYIKSGSICVSEWTENVKSYLPSDLDIRSVSIEKFPDDESKRKIIFT